MTVSFNATFGGDVGAPKHRKVITEIKSAIDKVLQNNGVVGSAWLNAVKATHQPISLETGEPTSSPYESLSVNLSTAFHVNED